jgi:hypothetical protein
LELSGEEHGSDQAISVAHSEPGEEVRTMDDVDVNVSIISIDPTAPHEERMGNHE